MALPVSPLIDLYLISSLLNQGKLRCAPRNQQVSSAQRDGSTYYSSTTRQTLPKSSAPQPFQPPPLPASSRSSAAPGWPASHYSSEDMSSIRSRPAPGTAQPGASLMPGGGGRAVRARRCATLSPFARPRYTHGTTDSLPVCPCHSVSLPSQRVGAKLPACSC